MNKSTVRGKYIYPIIKLPLEYGDLIGQVVEGIYENDEAVLIVIFKPRTGVRT